MLVYQKKARERIQKELRKKVNTINSAKDANVNESDTRTVVMLTLSYLLGWSKIRDGATPFMTSEHRIKGGFADFALIRPDANGEDNVYAIIEVKRAGTVLHDRHFRQARDYAINAGVKWVVLTNGDDWQVYRIEIDKSKSPAVPVVHSVFSVVLSDTNIRPSERANLLYYLSEEASRKDELEELFVSAQAIAPENLAMTMLNKSVITEVRRTVQRETGQKFTDRELAEAIVNGVINPDILPDNAERHIKREFK